MFNNTIVCKNLFCLFILLLLISSLISPSEKNISIIDRNFDGKTEQTSKLIHKKFSVRSALDTNMVIGMIQTGSYQVPFNRLQKLGYHNINLLSPSSGLDVLIPNEIVILPVCWADSIDGAADTIMQNSEDYKEYVQMGGGLFVEQPNPYCQPGDSIIVTLLPQPVTFHNLYNENDYPPAIIDSFHTITSGLSGSNMPFPADSIGELDTIYHVLVQGRISGSPSLFITEYGNGKVLVHTAHSSPTAIIPMSDTVYVRMINWVKSQIIISVDEIEPFQPEQFQLHQNYPNPFNPNTTIQYSIMSPTYVNITIYNLTGQKIKCLINQFLRPGHYSVQWDGTTPSGNNVPSGVYIYRITTRYQSEMKKMILLK